MNYLLFAELGSRLNKASHTSPGPRLKYKSNNWYELKMKLKVREN